MKKSYVKKIFISIIILMLVTPIIWNMPITLSPTALIECNVPTIGEVISNNLPEPKMLKALRKRDDEEISKLLSEDRELASKMINDRKRDLIDYSDNKCAEYYYSKELITKTYPLHIATSIYPSEQIVELLIQNNADINALDHSEKSALHLAILFQQYEICKKLLDAGINVNIKDDSGMSAIHYAVKMGNIKYVDLVLENGANINDMVEGNSSIKGETPLVISLDYMYDKYVNDEKVTTLAYINEILNRGANLDMVEDIMFVKSLTYCEEFSFKMLQNGYEMKREYHTKIAREAIGKGYINIVKILLDDGFDLNQTIEPDYYGTKYTALGWALHHHSDMNDNSDMIEFLIANGANIYFKPDDDNAISPIEYVEEYKDFDKETLIDIYNKYN